jgi:hypothetical protein
MSFVLLFGLVLQDAGAGGDYKWGADDGYHSEQQQ